VFVDYTAFGSGPNDSDLNSREEACRDRYNALLKRMGQIEKAESIQDRLEHAGVRIEEGEDDHGIIAAAVQNEVISCDAGHDAVITLQQVRYSTLARMLLIHALQLDDDDVYACFGRDPCSVSVPGYSGRPLRSKPEEALSRPEEDTKGRIRRNLLKAFGRTEMELSLRDDDRIFNRKKKNLKRKIAEQITRTSLR